MNVRKREVEQNYFSRHFFSHLRYVVDTHDTHDTMNEAINRARRRRGYQRLDPINVCTCLCCCSRRRSQCRCLLSMHLHILEKANMYYTSDEEVLFIYIFHLKSMDLIITILPVVTADLPISPRFTPLRFFIVMHVQQYYHSSTNG